MNSHRAPRTRYQEGYFKIRSHRYISDCWLAYRWAAIVRHFTNKQHPARPPARNVDAYAIIGTHRHGFIDINGRCHLPDHLIALPAPPSLSPNAIPYPSSHPLSALAHTHTFARFASQNSTIGLKVIIYE